MDLSCGFIALVGIIVIVLIYLLVKNSDWYKRKRASELFNESIGVMDAPAQEALAIVNSVQTLRPADRLIRGQLLAYNMNNDGAVNNPHDRQYALGAAAEDFMGVLLGIDEMEAGQRGHALHAVEVFGDNFLMPMFGAALEQVDPRVREEDTRARMTAARAIAETKAEAIDNYFDQTIDYKADPQNVHDTALLNDLSGMLNRIKSSNVSQTSAHECIIEAQQYLTSTYSKDPNNKHKVDAVGQALGIISAGNTISKFNDTESGIFAHVWNRCKHPYNADRVDNMKQAILDALADCIEGGKPVCIMGRTARVINSLATVDHDPQVADAAMTYNAYKNQILKETLDIINNAIETAQASDDDSIRAVGEYFASGQGEINPDDERAFIDGVKHEIDINLQQYKDKFSSNELEKIRLECYAGIDI